MAVKDQPFVQRANLTATESPSRSDSGMVRHETFDGTPHIVMPAVLVRSQVLSDEEYLPFEEIQDSVEDWRGVPVVVHHPEKNGQFVSAKKIDVREQEKIGFVAEPRAVQDDDGGKLVAELWLDEEKVRQDETLFKSIKQAKNRNEKLEVSTGYRCEIKRGMGMDGSTKFYKKQTNIRPDHLALLPDGIGNCSVSDGCGAPRLNQRSQPREPDYDGAEASDEQPWGEVSKDLSNYIQGYLSNTDADMPEDETWDTVEALPQQAKNWIASKTMLGVSNAETTNELIYFPVVNPETNNLNEGALMAVISGRGEQADIDDQTLMQTEAIVRRLLQEEFGMEPDEEETQNSKSFAEYIKEFFTANEQKQNVSMIDEQQMQAVRETVDELFEMHGMAIMEDLESEISDQYNDAVASFVMGSVGNEITELLMRMSEKAQRKTVEKLSADVDTEDEGGEEQMANEDEQDARLTVLEEAGIEDADELSEVLNAGIETVNEREERKNELVDSLCENDDVDLECNELEGMTVNALEVIEGQVNGEDEQPTDYSGQGGPRNNGGRVNDDDDAPTLGRPSLNEDSE
jgi:hypothetical protein